MEKTLANEMVLFLRELTHLVNIHLTSENPKVLWYDSITKEGHLAWQNALNEENECFFQACHGIFTNYFWKDEKLDECITYARERKKDVYVGVDVFGRCREQIGGFNSFHTAQKALTKGLSVAIFAPGWTYENEKDNRTKYEAAERKFWGQEGIGSIVPSRPLPLHLPLYSSFCTGNGHHIFRSGFLLYSRSWSNLLAQDIQPISYSNIESNDSSSGKLSFCFSDAFDGSCSLRMDASFYSTTSTLFIPLYHFDIENVQEEACNVSFTRKQAENSDFLFGISLRLTMSSGDIILLTDSNKEFLSNKRKLSVIPPSSIDKNEENGWEELFFHLPSNHIEHVSAVFYPVKGFYQDDVLYGFIGSISITNKVDELSECQVPKPLQGLCYSESDHLISWYDDANIRNVDIFKKSKSAGSEWLGRAYLSSFPVTLQGFDVPYEIVLVAQYQSGVLSNEFVLPL